MEGKLTVESLRQRSKYLYIFPISLPAGSRKEITAVPFISANTFFIKVKLRGANFHLEDSISIMPINGVRLIVAVGDEIGGLEWLRKLNSRSNMPSPAAGPPSLPVVGPPSLPESWSWAYCRPEDFPKKTTALFGVGGIILCSGAERLTMDQWKAIRRWVMLGGVLIVPGGSSPIYMRHVALASILPVSNIRTKMLSNWQPLGQWVNAVPPSEPSFVTVGIPVKDAKTIFTIGRDCLIAIRRYGCGAVLFMGFNPWDKPFRGWSGLPSLWLKIVAPCMTNFAMTYTALDDLRLMGNQDKAFGLDFPSGLSIFMILLGYLIAVPLSWSLLRRKGLSDWHWLVAPAIALFFTFIVFLLSYKLYQLGNQNISSGILVLTSNESDGYLIANATLFFKRGGLYNLNFGDAESILGEGWEWLSDIDTMLTVIEGRTLTVPLRVPNLGFESLYFVKPMLLKGTVKLTLERKGKSTAIIVDNQTPFVLKNAKLVGIRTLLSYGPHSLYIMRAGEVLLELAKLQDLSPWESKKAVLSLPATISKNSAILVRLIAEVDNINITPIVPVPSRCKSFVKLLVIGPVLMERM